MLKGGGVSGARCPVRDAHGDGIYGNLPEDRPARFRERGHRVHAPPRKCLESKALKILSVVLPG